MPNIFLGVGFVVCFLSIFFQNLSTPSPLHGLCCFSEHWADLDLHYNWCAPLPHMGTLRTHQEDDKEMQN